MGYTTYFRGEFTIEPQLSQEHREYLRMFSETRRMRRDAEKLIDVADPAREAVGLPLGPEGAYFVAGGGFFGQDRDSSIVDYNEPPAGQPGLWCQWVPSDDGNFLIWNEAEKFYDYEKWLAYLIDHFLSPWGYVLNGEVEWNGEDSYDLGQLRVDDNVVHILHGRVVYEEW